MTSHQNKLVGEGLTYDDVLLVPAFSEVLPREVNIQTKFTRNITINVPIISAAMDTVTESKMAIAMAQEGGIGVLHKNMTIEAQATKVRKVKRAESGMIIDPVTLPLTAIVADAKQSMAENGIGGIPIVDETVTENFFIERPASVTTSYMFAAESFSKAADLLPYFDDPEYFAQGSDGLSPGTNLGRAHKNAALGYLARTHLHNAQYDSSSWQKVIDACNQVINSGKNQLESNFEDVFKIANNWGPEYLWSVPSNVLGGSMFPGAALENKGWGKYNGWGYFAPTLNLYESYEAGDTRREATLLAFGDEFQYFGESRRYWSTTNLTGFQLKKYLEPYSYADGVHLSADGDQPTTDLNLPLLRYSHILLMKAEASIMLSGAGAGDTEINIVRTRAGLSAKSGATLDDLKAERRTEFAGELFGRYEDLCRWGDASNLTEALRGRIHTDKSDPDSGFTVEEVWPARPQFDISTHHILSLIHI